MSVDTVSRCPCGGAAWAMRLSDRWAVVCPVCHRHGKGSATKEGAEAMWNAMVRKVRP